MDIKIIEKGDQWFELSVCGELTKVHNESVLGSLLLGVVVVARYN
jgi:hypothetical protein